MKTLYKIASLLLMSTLIYIQAGAQTKKQEREREEYTQVKEAVDSKNYVFNAQTMIPMSGFTRQLNGAYDLSISDYKINSFLPYMGRLYTAPIDPAESPLRFTSTDFDYTVKEQKKGGWQVSIKPKDVRSVREFVLNISTDGYATLQVSGNDRQPITFYGYISEKA